MDTELLGIYLDDHRGGASGGVGLARRTLEHNAGTEFESFLTWLHDQLSSDRDALDRVLQAHPKAPRKLAAQLWEALTTPLPDENEAPPPRTGERDRKALRRLQDAVAARSGELGLPDGVLASRRRLESLLDGEDWPGVLSGWRRAQLEPALAPLLEPAGEAGATSV